MADAKATVNLKIKARLKVGVKLVSFLYCVKLNRLADRLFAKLVSGVEKDVMKYVKVEV